MKIKNILLPALAIAIFAAPTMALDFDNYKQEMSNIMSEISIDMSNNITRDIKLKPFTRRQVLKKIHSKEQVTRDDFVRIGLFAKRAIRHNISAAKQYELMEDCIIYKQEIILVALISGGFDPTVDMKFDTTLPARAVEYNDLVSFLLTFDITDTERAFKVVLDLERMDLYNNSTSLVDRFTTYISIIANPELLEDGTIDIDIDKGTIIPQKL